jgi:hypothetical protein
MIHILKKVHFDTAGGIGASRVRSSHVKKKEKLWGIGQLAGYFQSYRGAYVTYAQFRSRWVSP